MEFIVDTEGDANLVHKPALEETADDGLSNAEDDKLADLIAKIKIHASRILAKEGKEETTGERASERRAESAIRDFFAEIGWGANVGEQSVRDKTARRKRELVYCDAGTAMKAGADREMAKSIVGPGFEKKIALAEYNASDRRLKAVRKREREKTKGPSWYNMPAPEITDELKNDLEILKMRSALDPKHFYKKNDMKVLPKYFQVGKVVDSPLDHANERLTKKERKRTLVDELMADAEFNRYNKKKYKEIVEEKRKSTYKTYIKDKRKKNKDLFKKNKETSKKKRGDSKPKKTSRYA